MTTENRLRRQVAGMRENPLVRILLNATGLQVLLLNADRRILFASDAFCRMVGMENDTPLIGLRPGNSWQCLHVTDAPEGCGASEACRHCQAFNTVSRAMSEEGAASGEVSVQRFADGVERTLNVREHVVPVELFDTTCYVVTLLDISDTLHRRWLERLFFHDMLNKVGAMANYFKLLAGDVPEPLVEDMQFLEDSFRVVVEDIRAHKQLMDAEAGTLRPEWMTLVPAELLEQVARLFRGQDEKAHVRVLVLPMAPCPPMISDYLLLRRVLENMIKNAIEASEPGSVVMVGCMVAAEEIPTAFFPEAAVPGPGEICYHVRNLRPMSEAARHQVFQRSFSTKGADRGLGTWSMKVFGEQVLGGHVGFATSEEAGTLFYLRIPLTPSREGQAQACGKEHP